jgi:hypothetical protein
MGEVLRLRQYKIWCLLANEVATSMSYQLIKSDSVACPVNTPETSIHKKPEHMTPQKLSRQQLVNKLNYINFQDETILINFLHKKFEHVFACPAKPQPCLGEDLLCIWADTSKLKTRLRTYEFKSILLKDKQWRLELCLDPVELNEEFIRFRIPEIYYQLISKKKLRAPCQGIRAQMFQNSVIFDGTLIDFCATEFSVKTRLAPPQTSQWLNPKATINLLLTRNEEILYSGECRIVKETSNGSALDFLLKPINHNIQRFKKKRFRSTRENVSPAPLIRFTHPLTGNVHDFKVVDLSGSGFSVEETENTCVLLPGMILPDVDMLFANSFKIHFKAQVVYREKSVPVESEDIFKCGIAIIDIALNYHENLMGLLHQKKDKNAFISNEIEMDNLWEFFFDSGFLYPRKFEHIHEFKPNITNTYKTLYTQHPNIARHFIYKTQNLIHAHMSSIRFYENSWLIHHHAARRSSFKSGGLSVLNQIGRFINDSHRLHSAKMDFVFCYYRNTNKFPNRVFGGASRNINNPKACSVDPLAYLYLSDKSNNIASIPWCWELTDCEYEDLKELNVYYKHTSNGLMLNALNLSPSNFMINNLSDEFNKIGLKRERYLFSLKKEGILKAVFMVNLSDNGLNLSELTNSITVYVIDSDDLPFDILNSIIKIISEKLKMTKSPIMVYPIKYMEKERIPFERIYNLWILNMSNTDNYFRYLKRLLKFIHH